MAPSRHSRRDFGYIHTKAAPAQLREVLNVEDEEEYDNILSTIKCLTGKKLDLEMTGRSQKGRISSIEKELQEKYPNTLGATVEDSDRCLYFVYKYILYIHSQNRLYKDKNDDTESQKIQNNMKVHTMSTRRSSTSFAPKSSAEERAIEISSSDNENALELSKEMKRNEQSNRPLGSAQTSRASHPSIITPLSQTSSSKVLSQDSLGRTLTFSKRPRTLPPSASNPNEVGISDQDRGTAGPIYEFLDTCLPSMRRHLQSFLDFGCDTSEHLFSMSLWQPIMIQEFLNKLPPGRNGERLTEMEKLIIQNHLLTYFKS